MTYIGKTPREATEEDFREKRRDMLIRDAIYAVCTGVVFGFIGFILSFDSEMGGWAGAAVFGILAAAFAFVLLDSTSSEQMERWRR